VSTVCQARARLAEYAITGLRKPDGVPSYTGYETTLENDLIGVMRTGSANSLITDSAAAATAVATGFKTTNGIVGASSDGKALGTILEAAKEAGYLTG
jgi:alkaline phosphatase